jgi:hypothetical protein
VILAPDLGSELTGEPNVTFDFAGGRVSFLQSQADRAAAPLHFIAAIRMPRTFCVHAQSEVEHWIVLSLRAKPAHAGASGHDSPGCPTNSLRRSRVKSGRPKNSSGGRVSTPAARKCSSQSPVTVSSADCKAPEPEPLP